MKTKLIYIAKDGKEFETKEEYLKYSESITPEKFKITTTIGIREWGLYEQLIDDGFYFSDEVGRMLKFALNEVKVEAEVDSETGIVKVLKII